VDFLLLGPENFIAREAVKQFSKIASALLVIVVGKELAELTAGANLALARFSQERQCPSIHFAPCSLLFYRLLFAC
jgi:hypothetical protein